MRIFPKKLAAMPNPTWPAIRRRSVHWAAASLGKAPRSAVRTIASLPNTFELILKNERKKPAILPGGTRWQKSHPFSVLARRVPRHGLCVTSHSEHILAAEGREWGKTYPHQRKFWPRCWTRSSSDRSLFASRVFGSRIAPPEKRWGFPSVFRCAVIGPQ